MDSSITLIENVPVTIDMAAAAKKLGIRAIWELSIPGKVAPVTAGQIMKQTVYNIMEEWRCRA